MNNILILDDHKNFAEALKHDIYEFEDYQVGKIETTCTPIEAITLANRAAKEQQPFNVLLLDQNLDEEMDGIQVMGELLDIYADADAVIFTGYDTPEDGVRAYKAGASRYIPKPFESKELEFILKELNRSRIVRLAEAHQRRRFKIATSIAEAVGASLSLESTMDAILGTLYQEFEKTRLCVLLYNEREKVLYFGPATMKYYEIENPKYTFEDNYPLENGTLASRAARLTIQNNKMELVYIDNVQDDLEYLDLNSETKSECCVGLLNMKGELLGVLVLERETINGFDENDLDLIQFTARHISIAIERAHQSEELKSKTAIAAQTSWAASLAHELNNETGKIANWAHVIQQHAAGNTTIMEAALLIEESAYYLSSNNPWAARSIKIFELDEKLKNILEKTAPKRSIFVEYHLNAEQAKIKVSAAQFQFIVKQLVNNAAKAMQGMEEKKVIVSTKLIEGQYVEILFQDIGPGISDKNRMAVFQWSFTTKETGGFGLLFTRQMVEDMHGSIVLLPSKPKSGATFLIRIPTTNPE